MPRAIRFGLLPLILASIWVHAWAGDLVIYDDASENGFNQGCSFDATPNFAETAVVHSGTFGISFAPAQFGAVSWCAPMSLSTTDYSGITFWVNGGASGGQDLQLVIGLAGAPVASASLASLLGQAIPANSWVPLTASFDNAPTQYSGNFDQISIQDNSGNAAGSPQPTVYFDDASLIGRVSASDEIFKNGFEAVTTTATIQIQQNLTACTGNLTTERYTWQDSGGWTRSATLSHNDTNQNGGHEGELCDYTYHTDAATVRDVQELTSGGAGGFGYVVSHLVYQSAAYNAAISHDGDDSPLGHGFTGTYTRLLNGRHHAILRFQLNYPRWGVPASNIPTKYNVPVTIDWLIATGRDHPLWSVTYNLTAAPNQAIEADSRAPYGDMAFDGAGSAAGYGNSVGGVAWGDHYKFTTTGTPPMTLNSSWTWNQPNTVPYVYLWTQNPAPDAEMGIVQTEDIAKQDAGSEFSNFNWNTTSTLAGQGCPSQNYVMPCVDFQWAYQANADDADTAPEGDKHLTWGTGYGFLGDTAYPTDGSLGTGVGWPYQSYSTHITFGTHSASVTTAQVTQVENAMSSTLSASVGTALASGPAGVNRGDTRPYQPTGYNRVYGTWEVNAFAGAATVTLDAGAGTLANPMFVVHNHAATLPANVTLDGTALTADVDYFATVDAANSDHADTRLWITINRAWTGSHALTVN
ncbi:MAG: hypothetical protein P4L92_15995 [Rudaea sp.]|nr:hypothetical protein [Rudaea sp.]